MAGAVSFAAPDTLSLEAASDLSAQQFKWVKVDTAGKLVRAAANTDILLGILQNKPKAGQAAMVKIGGGSKLKVDAATDIVAGDALTSDANGKGVKTTAALVTRRALALEGATLAAAGDDATGEVISVLLLGPWITAAS